MSDFTMVVGNWTVDVHRDGKKELIVECTKEFRVITLNVYLGSNGQALNYDGHFCFPVIADIALNKMGINTDAIDL